MPITASVDISNLEAYSLLVKEALEEENMLSGLALQTLYISAER